ncbi:MAG: hypothetical protein AAF611_13055 [Bacteroidota bacterium]
MKKNSIAFILLIVSIFVFQSCSSDDDAADANPGAAFNNEISIGGTIYTLDGTAVLQSYGTNDDGSFDRDIEIFSTDLFLEFDVNTNAASGVSSGTYTYSNARQNSTFYSVEIQLRENNLPTDILFTVQQQGSVNISNEGNTTTITFNLMTQDGTEILGQWSGVIQ